MTGNAGKGRKQGSRNKLTTETLSLAKGGETPLALMVRVSQDTKADVLMRLNAARWAAPYFHPRPQPEPRFVNLELPDPLDAPESLLKAHATIMQSVASGDLALEDARELSSIIETHRRLVEITELETRIAKLEKDKSR